MNTRTKAFTLSLSLHTLMAILAMGIVTQTRPLHEPIAIPLKTMNLVSLSNPSAEIAPAPKQISKPAILPPQPRIAPLTPVVQPDRALRKEAPVSAPLTQIVPTTAPSVPTAAPSTQAVEAHPVVSKSVSPPVSESAPAPTVEKKAKPDVNTAKKSFFAALRGKIQHQLRYPAAARRRGMEGDVTIRFVLENSGTIHDIDIRQGEAIFHEAAKTAVASASGIAIPEVLSETLPTQIDLVLEFRLN
ncbi:MAG: TonB family protein [Sulfuricurvum sp.]|jgi:TonB family protein|uniref:TonB family protein n=1 Tax=Sulfuricurvum sp. TaxID=2025608 RepID=UPI0025F422B7|nr:TonB family protein [Sulfuricurvum sp.]MCK9373930.1 TonB family protein [Sulfuricurvum sp.]